MEQMRHLNREEMILIFFNGKNKVIKELKVSVGTVNQTVASPRELFLEALRCEAVSVLMIHNHPSVTNTKQAGYSHNEAHERSRRVSWNTTV